MTKILEGKVAFITGSASGIGLEMARKFASEGAKVVISDMNTEKCEETAAALNADGFMALSAPCDVTDEEAYKNAIQLAKETFGTVDILINNAGFQYVAPIEEFPTAVYEKLIKGHVNRFIYRNQKCFSNYEGSEVRKNHQHGFY